MIKRALVIAATSAALLTTAAGTASARPVHDTERYCGPGLAHTVFDHRTGGLVTTCLDGYYVPRKLVVPRPATWWNSWTW